MAGNACLWAHSSSSMPTKYQKQHDRPLTSWMYESKPPNWRDFLLLSGGLSACLDAYLLWEGGLSACFSLPHPLSQRRDGRLFAVFAAFFACVDYRHVFTWTIGIFRGNLEIRGGLSAYWRWTIGMREVDYRHGFGGLSTCGMPIEPLRRLG